MNKKGIGSHQSTKIKNDEWLTPPDLLQKLGEFDLDPCAPVSRPWNIAKKHYTIEDNGIMLPWEGFVFCNPPYGNDTSKWLDLMCMHNNGILLMFARTETDMFVRYVWQRATSLRFIYGRLYFYNNKGQKAKTNSGAPSVLVGYGDRADQVLKNCDIPGKYIKLNPQTLRNHNSLNPIP